MLVEVGLVPRDEHAVLGGYEIRLDEVGALGDGGTVSLERVLGQVAGCAAMADDDRLGAEKRRESGG